MARGMRALLALAAVLALALPAAPAGADAVRENRLFVSEFALFVKGRLAEEPRIRKDLDLFIMRNRDKVKQGFGMHPELVPEMYEIAGLARMNCVQGRYFDELTEKLSNEERHFFYRTAQTLDWWVMMLAVEEAERLKAYSPTPPLSFRPLTDIPYYMGIAMRTEINPYLGTYISDEDRQGLSFDRLPCE